MDEIRAADAQPLAICVDAVEDNARVVDELKLDFPILSDPDLVAINAYGLRHAAASIKGTDIARPAVFVIDRDGVVQWRKLTENWRIRARPEEILEQVSAIP